MPRKLVNQHYKFLVVWWWWNQTKSEYANILRLNKSKEIETLSTSKIEARLPKLSRRKVFSYFDARNIYAQYIQHAMFSTLDGNGCYLEYPLHSRNTNVDKTSLQKVDQESRVLLTTYLCLVRVAYSKLQFQIRTRLQSIIKKKPWARTWANKDKLDFRETEMIFVGYLKTRDGLKPDENIKAVNEMFNSTDVEGFRRLLGFGNYMSEVLLSRVAFEHHFEHLH